MRTNTLIAMAAVTAAVVAAAVWSVAFRTPAGAPASGPLFLGLMARVNDVTKLEVTSHDHTATVARGPGGAWIVEQKDGYRAAPDAVKSAIVGLAEASIVEPRTALPDLYQRIGVQDPETPGSASTRITVSGADGKPLAALILGKAAGSGTLYARRAGEAQSWLIKASLGAPEADPLHWTDRSLPAVAGDAVAAVEIRQPDGGSAGVRRDAKGQPFAAFGLPDGAKPNPSAVQATAEVPGLLTVEDVARFDPALFSNPVVTTVRTFDGLVLTVRTARRDGQSWVAFEAAGDSPAAKDWRARTAGWQYRVYEALGGDLTRPPAGFVAPEEPKHGEAKQSEGRVEAK